MSLPASDTFTGSNGTALPTHNAGWVDVVNSIVIQSNAATGILEDDCYAYWTGDTFAADQYSKASVQNLADSGRYASVIARASGANGTFSAYVCTTDGSSGSNHTEIAKVVNNTYFRLKAVATTFATGNTIEIRCTGSLETTVALYKNGVLIDSIVDEDSPLESGSAGIGIFTSALPTVDNWEGGNLSAGSVDPGVIISSQQNGTFGPECAFGRAFLQIARLVFGIYGFNFT